MRFRVSRASQHGRPGQPCEGAELVGEDKIDREIWVVEINTFEELLEFQKKFGEVDGIILRGKDDLSDFPNIVIYDDYVE